MTRQVPPARCHVKSLYSTRVSITIHKVLQMTDLHPSVSQHDHKWNHTPTESLVPVEDTRASSRRGWGARLTLVLTGSVVLHVVPPYPQPPHMELEQECGSGAARSRAGRWPWWWWLRGTYQEDGEDKEEHDSEDDLELAHPKSSPHSRCRELVAGNGCPDLHLFDLFIVVSIFSSSTICARLDLLVSTPLVSILSTPWSAHRQLASPQPCSKSKTMTDRAESGFVTESWLLATLQSTPSISRYMA